MLDVFLELLEAFMSEIAKRLGDRVGPSRSNVCRELLRLFVASEELLQHALTVYGAVDSVADPSRDQGRGLRKEIRGLLHSLERFEERLRVIALQLDLLDESDVSIQLVQIPESSYALFKTYLAQDLAPRLVAERRGARYLLKVATSSADDVSLIHFDRVGHVSVDLNQLFREGVLRYELRDLERDSDREQLLSELQTELVRIRAAVDMVSTIIRKNCDLSRIL